MDINEKSLEERVEEMSWLANDIPVVHKDYCLDIVKELESVKRERDDLRIVTDRIGARLEVLTTQRNDLVALCEKLREEYTELSEKLHDEI